MEEKGFDWNSAEARKDGSETRAPSAQPTPCLDTGIVTDTNRSHASWPPVETFAKDLE